jgi:serine/threonine-protein kinase ATR
MIQPARPLALPPLLLLAATALGAAEPPAVSAPKPLLRDFMGINFHTFQVPDAGLYGQACHLARDYHPYPWDVDAQPGADPAFPLTREGIRDHKPIDWLEIYGAWRAGGITSIDACITATDWTRDHAGFTDMPADLERYGKAFAGFFGPSGAHHLVDAVEVENEPGAWSEADYVTLFKAMASGLRAGDPKLTIATCTMSAEKPDQWEKPIQSLDGLEALYDVINMHTYSFKAGWPSFERTNPEAPGIRYLATVEAMIAYRAAHPAMHGKKLWVTEFGYDAASAAALTTADPKWVSSTELQQAQWLVRSYLVFAAMEVDRAYLYFFDDGDGNSFHGASGLTRKGVPKPGYYAVRHLQAALGGYRFRRVVARQAGEVYAYEFASDAGETAWAVWSPTSGQADAERTLPGAPRKPQRAERLAIADGKPAAVPCAFAARTLTLTVGETPVFVFFGK